MNDDYYPRSRLEADMWYLRSFVWHYDPPEPPKDYRTGKSIATIDELKRKVGVSQ